MKKTLSTTVAFILLYVLFMIPTYILPYFGSNSLLMDSMARAGGYEGPNVGFWMHLTCLLVLIYLAWVRTSRLSKTYLFVFPLLALFFDMTPFLSSIPLIPTVMHILTIILGVTLEKNTSTPVYSTGM